MVSSGEDSGREHAAEREERAERRRPSAEGERSEPKGFLRNPWILSGLLGIIAITIITPFVRHIPDAPPVIGQLPTFELVNQDLNYTRGRPGNYWCWWSIRGNIDLARMGFAVDLTTQEQRIVLIQEYLMRILGFLETIDEDCECVLADNAETRAPGYSNLDLDLVELLYRPEIYPGMSNTTATAALGNFK